MKLQAPAYIEGGKLTLYDPKGFTEAIQDVPSAGALLTLEVYTDDKPINQMRRYYRGVIVPHIRRALQELHGHPVSLEDTHALLKSKFFYKEIVDPETGEFVRVPLSLADNAKPDPGQVLQLLESSIWWAQEFLNITIPEARQSAPA